MLGSELHIDDDLCVIPYLGSISLYAKWLHASLCDSPTPQLEPKSLNRTLVAGANGLQRLSVPIEGGSRNLNLPFSQIALSEHGNWRRVHWGAIFSAYGRAPFFEHYEAIFRPVWERAWPTLSELNIALHERILHILFSGVSLQSLKEMHYTLSPQLLADYASYPQLGKSDSAPSPDLAIIDAIFALGPHTIFHLLHLNRSTL